PATKLTVVNQDTQLTREAVSGEDGTFNVPLLPPGRYNIRVEKAGFKPINQQNVTLEVNQVARLDFALEVGNVTETIEIKDTPALLDSDTSSIGQVIENRQITELPLNGRNFVQLATLSPGVSGVGYNATGTIMSGSRPDDSRPGSELFANGNREGSNNFLLDGVDNNDRLTLSITLRPSVEGVQEFKIQTSMFSAEQGRSPGATVNVISKSGTNQLHGSAYNFLRNSNLDARDYFAPVGQAKPAFRQNQFGASLGGPAIKNKLFYFGNYEGYRRRRTDAQLVSVPTAAMKAGDFSAVRDIFDPAKCATSSPAAGFRLRASIR
ncbi:MAG: carboxypeptidase-like regulatory domain-containing protein, partial [Acidobacteria bacterium]|nr:carboxypeptidase-like regulatory domain-containing protein [Acidobacteriota bacterium]